LVQNFAAKVSWLKTQDGNTPFMVAVKIGNIEAVKLLWNDFVNLDEQNVKLEYFLSNLVRKKVILLYILLWLICMTI